MTKRLFLLSPTTVFTARVDQTGFFYPVSEVDFDNGIALGTVVEGMTVVFGSSAGASDYGRNRVRAGSTLGTSGTLNFGRSSVGVRDGELYIQQLDAHITVWDDFRVWAKIPLIENDGTIYKDADIAYTDQTDDIPPKANIDPPAAAGDIATGTNVMTVSLASTGTYALSGTISSYLWDVGDGTITVGTSASSAITATFPAGFRWVSLTVTDSNANTHTVRAPIYARNPASDTTIKEFQIEQRRITTQGQEISLRILESIPEDTYPDGTLVMLWDSDLTTITDGSHMTFVGWHHVDPAQIEAGRTALLSEVTLDCLELAGKLKTLPGFPISVEGNDTPSTWLEMSAPNMDKYIDYILRWHSTALEIGHFTLSGTGSDYPFVILASDASSLWEQAARRAQSLVPDYVLTCDTNGRITMKPDPMIQPVGDRTATVQTTIDENEWSGLNYTHQRDPRVHWLRSEAILASATQVGALFSVAPDDTPGQGVSSRTHGEQLARNAVDLNASEGNRYARMNAFESHFRIRLAGSSHLDIEPADMTWVQLTMSAATAAQRGLNFTNERGIVHEINITHRYGREGLTKDVTLTWERETDGPAAKGYIPPTTGIDDDIPYEPDPDPGFDPDPGPNAGSGVGTVYAVTSDTLGRTRNFGADDPAWVDIGPGGTPGTLWDFILDPWAPATTGYLTADAGIYRSTDLDQASPSWTLIVSDSAIETAASLTAFGRPAKIVGSINANGYFALFHTMTASHHVYVTYTSDSFATWNTVLINIGSSSGNVFCGGADIVPHLVSGQVVLYAFNGGQLFKSSNGGATWAYVAGGGGRSGMAVHCPYDGNQSGDICYYMDADIDGTLWSYSVGFTVNSGSSTTTIDSGSIPFPSSRLAKRTGIESFTQNRQRMYRWVNDELYTSLDGFNTESAVAAVGISGNVIASGGFPFNSGQFYALTQNGIFVSTDGGASWSDKTGDWAFGFLGGNGTGVIAPLWTE